MTGEKDIRNKTVKNPNDNRARLNVFSFLVKLH